jgi:hypothetical protein
VDYPERLQPPDGDLLVSAPYPHVYVVSIVTRLHAAGDARCRCGVSTIPPVGLPIGSEFPSAVTSCPTAMLERIGELEGRGDAILLGRAEAYAAGGLSEREAVIGYLQDRGETELSIAILTKQHLRERDPMDAA